jgi:hypothetical protein
MYRTTSHKELWSLVGDYPAYFANVNLVEWLDDTRNIAIVEGENVALFDYKSPGTYWGHYFYNTARGREAVKLSGLILKYVLTKYPIKTILGLTPEDNKPARWLSRQIGMNSLGLVETINGQCELFFLDKDTYLWAS